MKRLFYFLCCVMMTLLVGCKTDEPAKKVETGTEADVTATTAMLNGVVNVDVTGYSSVECGIMYSTDMNKVKNKTADKQDSGVLFDGNFIVQLSGLTPETTYYYCAYLLINNSTYECGDIKEFTTKTEIINL